MNPNSVIQVENVWKRYRVDALNEPTTLKSALLKRLNWNKNQEDFWALQGVNMSIERSKTVGIIGNNGAGKSTLLRLIAGLSRPTKGRIARRGRLGSLLQLGTGFQSEFTGRENAITGCILSGLTRKEAEETLPKIVEFAELQDFIDSPVRTYSSGMYLRLAFAIEINLDPQVVLVDEVLAVGDLAFQKKCINRLLEMKKQGKTILLVSHSMSQVQALCDEVVWLENGRVRAQGTTKEIINLYKNRVFEKTAELVEAALVAPHLQDTEQEVELVGAGLENELEQGELSLYRNGSSKPTAPSRDKRSGTFEIELTATVLVNEFGQATNAIQSGDPLILHVEYLAHSEIDQPNFTAGIFDQNNVKVYEISNIHDANFFGTVSGAGKFNLAFSSLPLVRGTYYISVGAYEKNWEQVYCYWHHVCELTVEGDTPGLGQVFLPHRWQL